MRKKYFITQFLALIILLSFQFSYAQVFTSLDSKIGIDEKLGNYVPLDLKFINEKNDTVTLRSLINKPTVLSYVYFDCPGLCSPLQQGISDLIDKSNLEIGKDYNVMTVSFNYKDDPVKADRKKKNFASCVSKNKCLYWTYLTGDSASINKLMASTGYKVKVQGLDFAHPSAIIILSPDGKITRYLYGLSYLPFDFKMSVIEANKGLPRPSINRLMEYCFAYDSGSKSYALSVTKVSATLIIFILLLFLGVMLIRKRRKPKNEIFENVNE